MKAIRVLLGSGLLLVALALAKTPHAPLSPELMGAKTIFIENDSGNAAATDKCYDELSKWGRFKIVGSRDQADVVFQITTHSETTGLSGTGNDGAQNVTVDNGRSMRRNRQQLPARRNSCSMAEPRAAARPVSSLRMRWMNTRIRGSGLC